MLIAPPDPSPAWASEVINVFPTRDSVEPRRRMSPPLPVAPARLSERTSLPSSVRLGAVRVTLPASAPPVVFASSTLSVRRSVLSPVRVSSAPAPPALWFDAVTEEAFRSSSAPCSRSWLAVPPAVRVAKRLLCTVTSCPPTIASSAPSLGAAAIPGRTARRSESSRDSGPEADSPREGASRRVPERLIRGAVSARASGTRKVTPLRSRTPPAAPSKKVSGVAPDGPSAVPKSAPSLKRRLSATAS